MAFSPIWHGTWSSDVHDEAYGTFSLPLPMIGLENIIITNRTEPKTKPTEPTKTTDIRIHFDGEVCKNIMIMAYTYIPLDITRGTRDNIILDNQISVNQISTIEYKIVNLSGISIEGYYHCNYPKDNGIFSLNQSDITIGAHSQGVHSQDFHPLINYDTTETSSELSGELGGSIDGIDMDQNESMKKRLRSFCVIC